MVKVEDDVDDSGINASITDVTNAAINPQPAMFHATVKEEEGQPSSSSSHVRSQFIGMGFSPMLVDKVLKKHGDKDSDTILESLLSQSASQKSDSESSSSLGDLFESDGEENNSHLESRKEVIQDIKVETDSFLEKRSYLMNTMNFSHREVDLAINQLGEEASLEQLVECIVTGQVAGFSGGNENGDASNEGKAESLFGVMDKTLHLLQMGFTEEEVSSVIDNFGPEATVLELADSIFASRIANSIEQKEVKVEPDILETENSYSAYHPSNSGLRYYDDDHDDIRIKRAKHMFIDDSGGSSSHPGNQPSLNTWLKDYRATTSNGSVKEEFDAMAPGVCENVRGDIANPPYFFYGNVVQVPKATWQRLSGFLYHVEPEFLNSQYFSALSRKEGYIHNLPTEKRRQVVPKSPLTIEDALPFTRQCWPSWDTRKQIAGVTAEVTGVEELCDRLGKMIRESGGFLSQEKKMHIMHQCKLANLIWVGPDRLRPLEPHQVEQLLGYPHNHTNLFGLSPQERIEAMKYSFQIDTLCYPLSVLKDLYPDGLRVLSIYSGIGGAEIALHRLGIPLQCVISVEQSDIKRRILKRWWRSTGQKEENLRQMNSIWKLKINILEELVKQFGGFDLIIGGNFSSCKGGTTVNTTMGLDSNQFFEFVRVVQRVKHIMGRQQSMMHNSASHRPPAPSN